MTTRHRRRNLPAAVLTVLVLAASLGGVAPATAGGAWDPPAYPDFPQGMDDSAYAAQYTALVDAYEDCVATAGTDKDAVKTCEHDAKEDFKDLFDQAKDEIHDWKESHKGEDLQTGPVEPPTGDSEPIQDVPAVPTLQSTTTAVSGPSYDYRVLVIATDGNEADLGAIRQTLDFMGTPYDVFYAATRDLTAADLFNGDQAKYYAVILTNGEVGYQFPTGYASAFTEEEWNTLNSFEASFGVRQISWYTYPSPVYGYGWPTTDCRDTDAAPVKGTLTGAGKTVFSNLTTAPIVIEDAWTCFSKPLDASTTPLITSSDGFTLAATTKYPDGRENLSLTFDTNEYLVHSFQVSYGLINWVTKGKFVGQKRAYLDAQVDDFFYANDIWDPNNPTAGTNDSSLEDDLGPVYRMTGDDLQKTKDWQRKWGGQAIAKDLRLTLVYNGEGTSADSGYTPDTLTPKAGALQKEFKWVNHTWTHMNLNDVDYATAVSELKPNIDLATQMKFTNYSVENLVTPEISGLFNPAAMQAAFDLGIRYTVSDTSRPGDFGEPTPNAGALNTQQTGILMIPRRPTNLFYNVSTPAEWVSEYNYIHHTYWGRDLTYGEIIEFESSVLLGYLMRGEIYPWMFHQANVRWYEMSHSLLTDLLDATLNKYKLLFRNPVVSLRQDVIGSKIAERMALDSANVTYRYFKSNNTMQISSDKTVVVPLTGVKYGSSVAVYGGQNTSYITVPAGQTVTVPMA